jgi:ribosomal protein S27AE
MRGLRLVLALALLTALFGYGKGPLPPPGESEDKSGNRRCPNCGGVLRARGDKSYCRKCARVISKNSGDG